jgi:hypothetical protein
MLNQKNMKTLITTVVLLCTASLFSCTKTLYTHQEVMERYHTKSDVIKQFGNPAEKLTGETSEQWLYAFEKFPGQYGYIPVKNAGAKIVESFSRYDRFIIFEFDKQGDVIRSYANSVDFTKKKFAAGRTLALIGGIAGTAALIVWMIGPFKVDLSGATGSWNLGK